MISINHFRQELTEQMGRASASGAKDVLINSLDLCASIPKGNYAADSCCNAMQDEMKAGDVLLIDRNHTAGMTVRYFLPRVTQCFVQRVHLLKQQRFQRSAVNRWCR